MVNGGTQPDRAKASRADSRRNRERILSAALEAFVEGPQLNLVEVAERAGVTRATIYRHFPDRDALLLAMSIEVSAQLIPRLLTELESLSWDDALALVAERAITLGGTYREVILSLASRLEEAARAAIENEPIMSEILRRREQGEITSPLPDDWLALCVRTLCLAAVGRLADPEVDPADLIAQLTHSLRAIFA